MSKMKLSKFKDYSVLNTDSYDKRRFETIINMSKGLQNLNNDPEIPTFQPLLNDIWASLYKIKPEIKEEVLTESEMNKSFMEKIMTDNSFEEYRTFTKLDDLAAAVGTVKFGEQTKEWIEEQKKENEKIKELMEQIKEMQQQETEGKKGKSNKKMEQAMNDLNNQIQQALQNNSNSFAKAFQQAIKDTKDIKNKVNSLLGGSSKNNAEMKKVPLREQIELAEALTKNPKLKEIAEWAGKMKSIARKKQKSKHTEALDRNGVTIGNSIERLLPVELGMYMNPKTKTDFLRRYVEGETLQYNQKGKEELGKGPIVLCLDQSSSMKELDTQSKGFTLALMSIAKRQRRDFCLILFSTNTKVFKYERGKIMNTDMTNLATTFLGGGTDFKKPLSKSLKVIQESRFKKSDIVFVTDGEDRVPEDFIKNFNKIKKEKDFQVLSLVIGESDQVKPFSDRVVGITDFQDEKSFSAFEI